MQRRPTALLHATWIGMLTAAISCIVGGAILKIDKVVRAEGQIRSSEPSSQIVAQTTGRIHTVHVREGQRVSKGDRLVTIDPDATALSVNEARSRVIRLSAVYAAYIHAPTQMMVDAVSMEEAESRELSRKSVETELAALQAQLSPREHELAESEAALQLERAGLSRLRSLEPVLREKYRSYKELVANGFQSPVSILSLQQELIDIEQQILVSEARIRRSSQNLELRRAQVTLQAAEIAKIRAVKTAEVFSQLQQALQDLQKLSELSRNSIVEAPVDGFVEQLADQLAGNAIRTGELLMLIVPSKSKFELRLHVRNEDYPYLNVGQSVDVKFDAFPYTIYGTHRVTLTKLSRDILTSTRNGADYGAIADLGIDQVKLDGRAVVLRSGMRVSADIAVGHQRPIDLWLDPFVRFGKEAFQEHR